MSWPASSQWWIESGKYMPVAIRRRFWDQVDDGFFEETGRRLYDGNADGLWSVVYNQIRYQLRYEFWPIGMGHLIPLAGYDFFRRAGLVTGVEGMEPYLRLAEMTGWWWGLTNSCIMTDRPVAVHRNAAGRLHCENGPAILYPDGWGIYAWHGVRIPAWLIREKHRITPEAIKAEDNADLRAMMLEIFGFDRYIAARGAELIAQDEAQGRPRALFNITLRGEAIRILRFVEEQDAEQPRDRYVRVARHCANPQEAVVWQRGLNKRLADAGHAYAKQASLGHAARVTELTAAEKALLPVVREEWLQIGRATGPGDRGIAEEAISDIYRSCGLPPPSAFLWLGSPFAAAIAVLMLLRARKWRPFHEKVQDWTDRRSVHLREIADPILRRIKEQHDAQCEAARETRGWKALAGKIGDLLWIPIGDRVEDPADPLVKYLFLAPLQEDMGSEIWRQISGDARTAIVEEITRPIRSAVAESLPRILEGAPLFYHPEIYYHRIPGASYQEGHWLQRTAGWCLRHASDLAAYDFLNRIERVHGPERLEPLFRLARAAGLWWPFERACVISERPSTTRYDDDGRLHGEVDPAVSYPDGWSVHARHGDPLPGG